MKTINLGGGVYLAVFEDGTSILSGPDFTKFLKARETGQLLIMLLAKASPELAALLLALALMAR